MEYSFIKKNGEKHFINLAPSVFGVKYNETLIHQLIVFYLSNSHSRIKEQKSRSQVRGGGKKPWKQKGSGRARAGSIRSPIWRGGGKTFASKNKITFKKKINKKIYRTGMRIIFSELLRSSRLNIIEDIDIKTIKTKNFLTYISYLKIENFALFITNNINVLLSAKNLKYFTVISYRNLNPIILLKFKVIFITKSIIRYVEEYLK